MLVLTLNHKNGRISKETVSRSNSTQNQTGNYVINSGETKPRQVFVLFINDANIDEETANQLLFLYNTFSVSTNPRTLSNCFLAELRARGAPLLRKYGNPSMRENLVL